jgi:formylglycine-generating enzyme required for sulfatase activity
MSFADTRTGGRGSSARRRAAGAALALLPAACCGPGPAPIGVTGQAVCIHNLRRAAMTVVYHAHAEAVAPDPVRLGDAAEVRCELPLGRGELQVDLGGTTWCLPLPMPARARRPAVLDVCVEPPPPEQPGFAWIPAGPALIGDVLGVGQADERPARVVDVAGFWLARTETTNAEFARFLDAATAVDPQWCAFDSRKFRIQRGTDGHYASDAPTLPVVTVSHAGALAYCAWRTAATGRVHGLPTEVEWEKAARGPASSTYAYGDEFRPDGANQESGELRAVAMYPANGFGLHDMTGNAFEWTADVYGADAYANGRAPTAGEYRALRGGSFVLDGIFVRNSMRMKLRPGVRADDTGFRVWLEPDKEP